MILAQNTTKYVYLYLIILALTLAGVLVLVVPGANIKIIPYPEVVIMDYAVRLSTQVDKPAFNLAVLPVKIIKEKKSKQTLKEKYQAKYFLFFEPAGEAVFLLLKDDLKSFINYKIAGDPDIQTGILAKELLLNVDNDLTFWPQEFTAESVDLKLDLETTAIAKFNILALKESVSGKKTEQALALLTERAKNKGEVELAVFPDFMPWVTGLKKRIKVEVVKE